MNPQTQAPVVAHTPTPWAVTHQCLTDQSWDIIAETISGGQCVATCGRCESRESNTAANAHFICLAVNSHAALVEASEAADAVLALIPAFGDSIGLAVNKPLLGIALNKCRAALALAHATKEQTL